MRFSFAIGFCVCVSLCLGKDGGSYQLVIEARGNDVAYTVEGVDLAFRSVADLVDQLKRTNPAGTFSIVLDDRLPVNTMLVVSEALSRAGVGGIKLYACSMIHGKMQEMVLEAPQAIVKY